MDAILASLMELAGVSAVMVFDATGQLLGHQGKSVYDQNLCQAVSGALAKALDAVQLQQEDWENVTAHFADGKLVLRRVVAHEQSNVLALVADGSLNAPFATVALRVASTKLKRFLEGGAASSSAPGLGSSAAGAAQGARSGPGGSGAGPSDSKPNLAASGLSWSKISNVGLSRVAVADPASGAYLTRCAKELAQHVGPIAKVYVEEAVRRVSPEAPFALAQARALVEDLASQIEDADDRAAFQKALSK